MIHQKATSGGQQRALDERTAQLDQLLYQIQMLTMARANQRVAPAMQYAPPVAATATVQAGTPGTTTTIQAGAPGFGGVSVTVTEPAVGGTVVYQEPVPAGTVVYQESVPAGTVVYQEPVVTCVPMAAGRFNQVLGAMGQESFSDGKLRVLSDASHDTGYSVRQVRQVMAQFSFDDDKVDAAALMYPMLCDASDWFTVYQDITFDSSKDTLRSRVGR
jgi:hypothetical protein